MHYVKGAVEGTPHHFLVRTTNDVTICHYFFRPHPFFRPGTASAFSGIFFSNLGDVMLFNMI